MKKREIKAKVIRVCYGEENPYGPDKELIFSVVFGTARMGLPMEEIRELGLIRVSEQIRRFGHSEPGIFVEDPFIALFEILGKTITANIAPSEKPWIGYLVLENCGIRFNEETGIPELDPDHVVYKLASLPSEERLQMYERAITPRLRVAIA